MKGCRDAVFGSVIVLAGLLVWAAPSDAEEYPSRFVRLIVPYGAGTQTDVNARMIANRLEAALKQRFIVDNRPGGSGLIGSAFVSKSAPDGYTLLMTTNTTHAAVRALFKEVPYDPTNDFTPIASLQRYTSVLAVPAKLPAKSVQELVSLAKASPGTMSAGFANVSGQIASEALRRHTGNAIAVVPYRSTPQGMNDLAAGHIQIMMTSLNTAVALAEAGQIRILAVLSEERTPILPDVPTLNETIMPGFGINAWAAMFGPAHLPRTVVDRLDTELSKIMSDPGILERMKTDGLEALYQGPEKFTAFLAAEESVWTKLVKDAGIQPQ